MAFDGTVIANIVYDMNRLLTREFDTFFLTTYSTPLLNKPY